MRVRATSPPSVSIFSSFAANASVARITFSPYAWMDPARILETTSRSVWYEYPSNMDARSTPGRLPCSSVGSRNTLKSVSTGRFAKRTRSRTVAVATGRGACFMYSSAGHPPVSRNSTSGPDVPVASTLITAPASAAQGWCATNPCAACMKVSSPPFSRKMIGARGGAEPG